MARAFKNVITPVAIASFTWLERPDSGFEFSDDKYKVTLLFDKESGEGRAFKQKMDEMTQELASQEFGDKIKGIKALLRMAMRPRRKTFMVIGSCGPRRSFSLV